MIRLSVPSFLRIPYFLLYFCLTLHLSCYRVPPLTTVGKFKAQITAK